MLVFVYGTLKSGEVAHRLMGDGFPWGPAKTKERMAMFESQVPMVSDRWAVSRIHGELFEVPDKGIGRLDDYEGHPEFYERKEIPVVMPSGAVQKAWIYIHPDPDGILRLNGAFRSPTPVSLHMDGREWIQAANSVEAWRRLQHRHGSWDPSVGKPFVEWIQDQMAKLDPTLQELHPARWLAESIQRGMMEVRSLETPVIPPRLLQSLAL